MAYNHAPDEGLPEVVADPSPQALTNLEEQYQYHQQHTYDKYPVVYDDTPKLPDDTGYGQEPPHGTVRSPDDSVPRESLAVGEGPASGQENNSEKTESEPRICGIRRKMFFILLIVALVVVAAAIGGGVGGGVAAARSRKGSGTAASSSSASSSSTTSLSSSQTSTPPTSTSSGSTTTSSSEPSPTPTFLNNQTGPVGFGFQGFSGKNFSGNVTPIYRDEGFVDFGFDVWSYVWLPNTTSCCITFCEDQHNATGWRCQIRKQKEASDPFPRIYIWCDPGLVGKANNTCS